jgi:hypothetical protein
VAVVTAGQQSDKREESMKSPKCASLALIAALASVLATVTAAQSQVTTGTIADNDSIFVDGQTFTITPGNAKGDASVPIKALGARELGPGEIIFRSGDKLYVVDAPLLLSNRGPSGQNVYLDAGEARPNRIRIEYAPPKNPEHQQLYEMIKEHRVLESLQKIFSPFRLTTDLTIKTLGCDGMINSWYNTDDPGDSGPTVHMCYELLADILQNVPKETTPEGITPRDAIVGQFFFWTTHEIGHAMFDQYKTPLFGREEDAADQFAVFIMLQFGHDQARRLVGGAAYAANEVIKDYSAKSNVEKPLEKYSSVHGLPEQRFYNLVCWAYGADPKTFADVVDKGFLPKRRAGNCEYEYQSFKRAFASEMLPHIDRQMARAVLDTEWLPPQSASLPRR